MLTLLVITLIEFGTLVETAGTNASIGNDSLQTNAIDIPIEVIGRTILVKGSVGNECGYFVFDTGAPTLVLNKNYFSCSWESPGEHSIDWAGRTSASGRRIARNFEVGGVQFPDVIAKVGDLTNIERVRGVKIVGLLGLDIFTSYKITLDIHEENLRLQKLLVNESRTLATSCPLLRTDIDFSKHGILIQAQVGTNKLNFLFDTGSSAMVFDESVERRVLKGASKMKHVKASFVHSSAKVRNGILDEVVLGGYVFREWPVFFARLSGFNTSPRKSAQAIIGYDLISLGIVTVDFANRELLVYPFGSKVD